MFTKVKTDKEIKLMRESGKILSSVLNILERSIAPGMSTKELSAIAAEELKKLGGEPTFKGYQGFPDVLCVSINDEVVHGIPSDKRIIQEGDIVGMDFGVTYQGMVTDSARTVIVGKPKTMGDRLLVERTKASLDEAIAVVKDGVRTGDIGSAVEQYLKKYNYGIVKDLVGHGVGHALHEDPNIPNYGNKGTGPWLNKGMTIAIEPMVTLGTDRVRVAEDGWTILTEDGSRAAHFEHTVLITENGAEILTQ